MLHLFIDQIYNQTWLNTASFEIFLLFISWRVSLELSKKIDYWMIKKWAFLLFLCVCIKVLIFSCSWSCLETIANKSFFLYLWEYHKNRFTFPSLHLAFYKDECLCYANESKLNRERVYFTYFDLLRIGVISSSSTKWNLSWHHITSRYQSYTNMYEKIQNINKTQHQFRLSQASLKSQKLTIRIKWSIITRSVAIMIIFFPIFILLFSLMLVPM